MDTINIDEIGIKEKIKAEVKRIKKFQRSVLSTNNKIVVKDIDIRNYAKYVLKEATDVEKRELLGCLKSKIKLESKRIYLEHKTGVKKRSKEKEKQVRLLKS